MTNTTFTFIFMGNHGFKTVNLSKDLSLFSDKTVEFILQEVYIELAEHLLYKTSNFSFCTNKNDKIIGGIYNEYNAEDLLYNDDNIIPIDEITTDDRTMRFLNNYIYEIVTLLLNYIF